MLALDCKPARAPLHVYGFNWSQRHWRSHAIVAEERFIRLLVSRCLFKSMHERICAELAVSLHSSLLRVPGARHSPQLHLLLHLRPPAKQIVASQFGPVTADGDWT